MEINERAALIQRGREANDLLEHDTLNEAMNQVMNGLFASFVSTASESVTEREKLWAVGQGMSELKRVLEAYRDSGKVEQENAKHDEK